MLYSNQNRFIMNYNSNLRLVILMTSTMSENSHQFEPGQSWWECTERHRAMMVGGQTRTRVATTILASQPSNPLVKLPVCRPSLKLGRPLSFYTVDCHIHSRRKASRYIHIHKMLYLMVTAMDKCDRWLRGVHVSLYDDDISITWLVWPIMKCRLSESLYHGKN